MVKVQRKMFTSGIALLSYMVEKVREKSLQLLCYKLHSWQSLKEEIHFRYYTINSWWTKSKEGRSLLVLLYKLHSGQRVKKEGHFRYMVDKVRRRSLQVLHCKLHSGQSMKKKVISGTTLKITWWTKSKGIMSLQ
jgi:hypothetical protein